MKHLDILKRNIKKFAVGATVFAALVVPALKCYGVTPEEMDRARAIAACVYIRYVDDGSGYLDGFKPKSMGDVREKVKGHEKDEKILQEFMGAPVANDFDQWDKEKFVNYWSGEFFSNSGLSDRNSSMRNDRIRGRLNTMDVTAPAPKEEERQDPQQPEQVQQKPQQPVEPSDVTNVPIATGDSAMVQNPSQQDSEADKGSGTNWTLIILLVVLLAVVIALVAYGVKVMKGGNPQNNNDNQPTPQPQPRQPEPQQTYAAQSATVYPAQDSANEMLRRQLAESRRNESSVREHNKILSDRVRSLEDEVSLLRREIEELREQANRTQILEPADTVTVVEEPIVVPEPLPRQPLVEPERIVEEQPRQRIYLGRANRQRIFLRADRQFVPGKSIYRLTTGNELTGSFVVDSNPSIVAWVSLDPMTALAGACEVPTFAVPGGIKRIVTDSPGTAIFEDGCWKVLRPAAVHLE